MDEKKPLFAEVLMPLPVKGTFTYRIPVDFRANVEIGKRVVVRFGRSKIYSGLILKLHQVEPVKYKAKDIQNLLDKKPVVTAIQLNMWHWITDYYMAFKGEVMNAALPSAMKLASESKVKIHPAYDGLVSELSMAEHQIIENLSNHNALTIRQVSEITGYKNVMPLIKNLIDKEAVIMQEELKDHFKPKKESYLRLADKYAHSEKELSELLDSFSKKAYRQMEVMMVFLSKSGKDRKASVAKKMIVQGNEKYNAPVKTLISKGIFVEEKKITSRLENFESRSDVKNIVLSKEQNRALKEINQGFDQKKVTLLHGVTSSGKTELYIHLIADQLKKGRQVLYLLPEIALTAQIINRLTKFFGKEVAVYHSRFNEQERTEVWNSVLENKRKLIVGARSALFLPFHKLGLIIVDEEHDNSYKQFDPSPRYNGRDVAVYLGNLFSADVILGSATPSVESYANSISGKYHLVELFQRFGEIQMPEIEVADLIAASKNKEMYSHFSALLLKNIRHTLDRGLQVILFQNRRGFSLRIQCHQCGWMPECLNCDVGMIYHKYQNLLRCHYCGHKAKVPSECPSCGSIKIKMQGFGTEKIEEELPTHFPNVRIARMDLDSTR
ncbi:MAG: primosomal protein N', partial [Bacteroidales bacterium]|nr:primosomal protein N' [Bacteroidales bacterium]